MILAVALRSIFPALKRSSLTTVSMPSLTVYEMGLNPMTEGGEGGREDSGRGKGEGVR